jgi:DNA-binding transcriptional ArsR family regulator
MRRPDLDDVGRDFAFLGRALAAPARAAMLDLLMDGSTRPASELAAAARVNPATASEHLAVLTAAGLTQCERNGRHRFYRIVDPSVAVALEALGELCPQTAVVSLRQSRQARPVSGARLCYDHLAGRLGVELTDALVRAGRLSADFTLTDAGAACFTGLGVDVDRLRQGRRPVTRTCLDWTERRPHLAGSLGAALASLALERIRVRRRLTGRGLLITDQGRTAFAAHLGFAA